MNALLGLVPGQMLSDSADNAKDLAKKLVKHIELVKNLDDYDQRFIEKNELEIDQYGIDMEAVIKKRDRLVSFAKDCLKRGSISVKSNSKDEFTALACKEIGKDPLVVKRYLSGFYDLVYQNTTMFIDDDQRALATYLADHISEIEKEYGYKYDELNRFVNLLSGEVEELARRGAEGTQPVDFESYYQIVEQRFTTEKKDVYKKLVGSISDEESYIDAYITVDGGQKPVLSFLDEWFDNTDNRAILIYGEPGHGKSLLCDKAVFEFRKQRFLKNKANNVLAVSLNTGNNRSIIKDGEVVLENSLVWKAGKKNKFTFENCCGSLLFMDGLDEFIDEAISAETEIKNIYDFMESVNDIADKNDIHIVVLSRSIAVSEYLDALSKSYPFYELLPISEKQQNEWIDEHEEYEDYKKTLSTLQNNKNMRELLGIPLLFRLIVHSRFRTLSSNTVELYDNLFTHILKNRHIVDDDEIQSIEKGLMNLAFMIYCTDTSTAVLKKEEWDRHWIFAFYVRTTKGRKIGFFHRTIYQYFLAKYIYSGIINVTDENVENFIGSFAERQLDDTTFEYIQLLNDKKDEKALHDNLEKMINALCKTEAYLNPEPRVKTGTAEKFKILRSQNIYRNTLHIAAGLSYVIQIPFEGALDVMMRTYSSRGILLFNDGEKKVNLFRANLRGADLAGANFMGANLQNANLTQAVLCSANLAKADLTEADLNLTNLVGVDLRGANLTRATLEGANLIMSRLNGAILHGTNLVGVNLRGADLSNADLSTAHLILNDSLFGRFRFRTYKEYVIKMLNAVDLEGVNLTNTKINIKHKNLIDPSTKGYDSIEWVFDDPEKWL